MQVAQLAYLKLRKSLTDHSQRSTADLIEPQTLFYLVRGEKADNQKTKKAFLLREAFFMPNYCLDGLKWPSHDTTSKIFYMFKSFFGHDITSLTAAIAASAVDEVGFVFGKVFDL